MARKTNSLSDICFLRSGTITVGQSWTTGTSQKHKRFHQSRLDKKDLKAEHDGETAETQNRTDGRFVGPQLRS